jgi:hypothetical protein
MLLYEGVEAYKKEGPTFMQSLVSQAEGEIEVIAGSTNPGRARWRTKDESDIIAMVETHRKSEPKKPH